MIVTCPPLVYIIRFSRDDGSFASSIFFPLECISPSTGPCNIVDTDGTTSARFTMGFCYFTFLSDIPYYVTTV